MSSYVTQTSDKSKRKALILCACGGIIGLHNFYVGRIGRGLLFAITGGCFVFGWLIDLIKIATGAFRDNVGAPLREK
ncbi:MAG: TM2 domain-containing protein [Bacteroidales bacterium]|nr:TM2 domain-containing protein [Bacteroidales bacterium]